MIKRRIKIVILFIIVIALFWGGWYMYKRLDHDRQSFAENIYNYISPDAVEVVNINREYNLNEYLIYDDTLRYLTNVLGSEKPVPIVLAKYGNGRAMLTVKVNLEQQSDILEHIESQVALPYPVKKRVYKDVEVCIYSLPDGDFLVCAFHNGIFAASKSYKLIKNFIDHGSNAENTFFTVTGDDEIISKMLDRIPVSIFIKNENKLLALDYSIRNDTMKMEGHLYGGNYPDSLTLSQTFTPYIIDIPSNICVDSYTTAITNNVPSIKIILNKEH